MFEYRASLYPALSQEKNLQRRSHIVNNKAHKLCNGHDLHTFAAIKT